MIVIDTPLKKWSHLTSDNLDELHAFAALIGLRRKYFQPQYTKGRPHYDVYGTKYNLAVSHSAKPILRRHFREFLSTHHKPKQIIVK